MQPIYKKSIRIFSLLSLVLLAQCCCCFLPLRLQPPNEGQDPRTRILHTVQDNIFAVYDGSAYHPVHFFFK